MQEEAKLNVQDMFTYLKGQLTSYKRNCNTNRQTIYKENGENKYEFYMIDCSYDEFAAMKKIRQLCGGNFNILGQGVLIEKFLAKGKPCLTITLKQSEQIYLSEKGTFALVNVGIVKKIIYYGSHDMLVEGRNGKLWQITMKDLFERKTALKDLICEHIMRYFARENRIWNDLADDFLLGSAYSALPSSKIWESHSRQELIEKKYGSSLKRNNKEPIGYGIFIAQAKRVVLEDEIQKLFGFCPGQIYIGRKKADIAKPLANYIYENLGEKKEVRLPGGNTLKITKEYIEDAVLASIKLRRKISLSYKSANRIRQWHDEVSNILVTRQYDTVKFPKNSRYKKLKMPKNCVRLTTRKQFVEEGEFQHNCVATYIGKVNRDNCSIWSMRKDDGSRNTIEICIRKSKENPNGYFYIKQMTSFANGTVSEEDYKQVRDFLIRQTPNM